MKAVLLVVGLGILPLLAQQPAAPPPAAPPASPGVKVFELQFVDPEVIRGLFAGQSYVMDANRDLKILTAHGPDSFLKQVDDAVKKFDVAPPLPVNIQLTVYFLATAAQAPNAATLPKELANVDKELAATGAKGMKLADSHVLRARAGAAVEASGLAAPEALALSHIHFDSANTTPDPKTTLICLNGFRVSVNVPSATDPKQKIEPEIAAAIDITPDQPALVAKTGTDKPIAIVVQAAIVK